MLSVLFLTVRMTIYALFGDKSVNYVTLTKIKQWWCAIAFYGIEIIFTA